MKSPSSRRRPSWAGWRPGRRSVGTPGTASTTSFCCPTRQLREPAGRARARGPAAMGPDAYRVLHRRPAALAVHRARVPPLSAALPGRQGPAGRHHPARVADLRTGEPLEQIPVADWLRRWSGRAHRRAHLAAPCSRASWATTTGWPAPPSSGRSSRACTRPADRDSSARCSATSTADTISCFGRFREYLDGLGVEFRSGTPGRPGLGRRGRRRGRRWRPASACAMPASC